MNLQPWNSGYLLSEFQVQTVREDSPVVNDRTFLELQWELYPTGKQEDDIVLKVEQSHFEVTSSENTPIGMLGLPQEMIDQLSIRNPPKKCPVLVVKPWFRDYLSWSEAN